MNPTMFLEVAVSLTLQVTVVVAITYCLARYLPTPQLRYRLWTSCYIIQLGLLLTALVFPHLRLLQYCLPRELASSQLATFQTDLGKTVFCIWVVGATVSLLLFVYRFVQASRFLRSCTQVDLSTLPAEVAAVFGKTKGAPHIASKRVHLVASEAIAIPFCWQFHRPCIVLPQQLLDMPPTQLRLILVHEMEHLRSGHPLQLFLERVVEIVFWFHPLVWWGSRQTAILREFACDDASVDSKAEIVAYLGAMLAVAEHSLHSNGKASSSLSFGKGASIVAARTQRLVRIARGVVENPTRQITPKFAFFTLIIAATLTQFIWPPVNILASRRSGFSPWPSWTAAVAHDCGLHARDYEIFDPRCEIYELRQAEQPDALHEH